MGNKLKENISFFKKSIVLLLSFSLIFSCSKSSSSSLDTITSSAGPSIISGQITVPSTTVSARVAKKEKDAPNLNTIKIGVANATVRLVDAITKEPVEGISATTTDSNGNYEFDYDAEAINLTELKNTMIQAYKDVDKDGDTEKLIVCIIVPEFDETNLQIDVDETTTAKANLTLAPIIEKVGSLLEKTTTISEADKEELRTHLEELHMVYESVEILDEQIPDLTISIPNDSMSIDDLGRHQVYDQIKKTKATPFSFTEAKEEEIKTTKDTIKNKASDVAARGVYEVGLVLDNIPEEYEGDVGRIILPSTITLPEATEFSDDIDTGDLAQLPRGAKLKEGFELKTECKISEGTELGKGFELAQAYVEQIQSNGEKLPAVVVKEGSVLPELSDFLTKGTSFEKLKNTDKAKLAPEWEMTNEQKAKLDQDFRYDNDFVAHFSANFEFTNTEKDKMEASMQITKELGEHLKTEGEDAVSFDSSFKTRIHDMTPTIARAITGFEIDKGMVDTFKSTGRDFEINRDVVAKFAEAITIDESLKAYCTEIDEKVVVKFQEGLKITNADKEKVGNYSETILTYLETAGTDAVRFNNKDKDKITSITNGHISFMETISSQDLGKMGSGVELGRDELTKLETDATIDANTIGLIKDEAIDESMELSLIHI